MFRISQPGKINRHLKYVKSTQALRFSVFKCRLSPKQVELSCEFIGQTACSIGRHFSSVTLKQSNNLFQKHMTFHILMRLTGTESLKQ